MWIKMADTYSCKRTNIEEVLPYIVHERLVLFLGLQATDFNVCISVEIIQQSTKRLLLLTAT
jgi:hypothetical protein